MRSSRNRTLVNFVILNRYFLHDAVCWFYLPIPVYFPWIPSHPERHLFGVGSFRPNGVVKFFLFCFLKFSSNVWCKFAVKSLYRMMKVRYFSTLRDKQIDCSLKWKYSQIFRKNVKDTSKKSKFTGVILMKNGIFFKKNIHLNLIKQRVKWTSVVTD